MVRSFVRFAFFFACVVAGMSIGNYMRANAVTQPTESMVVNPVASAQLYNCGAAITGDRGVLNGLSFEVKERASCLGGSGGSQCWILCEMSVWDGIGGTLIVGWQSAYNLTCATNSTAHTFGPYDLSALGLPPDSYWVKYKLTGNGISTPIEDWIYFEIH